MPPSAARPGPGVRVLPGIGPDRLLSLLSVTLRSSDEALDCVNCPCCTHTQLSCQPVALTSSRFSSAAQTESTYSHTHFISLLCVRSTHILFPGVQVFRYPSRTFLPPLKHNSGERRLADAAHGVKKHSAATSLCRNSVPVLWIIHRPHWRLFS